MNKILSISTALTIIIVLMSCSVTEMSEYTVEDEPTTLQNVATTNLRSKKIETHNDATTFSTVLAFYDSVFSAQYDNLAALMADDAVVFHQGYEHEAIPFYSTFNGKQGAVDWIINIFTTCTLEIFDMRYFVIDGNRASLHVLERGLMNSFGTYFTIENYHSFVVNESGKIEYIELISDGYILRETITSPAGGDFDVEYRTYDYSVENYPFDRDYNRKIASLALKAIDNGNDNLLDKLIADDIELTMVGPEEIIPFAGKYIGKEEVEDFLKDFTNGKKKLKHQYTIAENNKVNIHFKFEGKNTDEHGAFSADAVLSMQLNEEGKIAKIFGHYRTEEIADAYSEKE